MLQQIIRCKFIIIECLLRVMLRKWRISRRLISWASKPILECVLVVPAKTPSWSMLLGEGMVIGADNGGEA
jgi:hypothetical protein